MMLVRCYLAPSAIEGLGVFVSEEIAKGDVVWRFDPDFDQVFPLDRLLKQPQQTREFLERYSYPHHEDPSLFVLDADEGRFMNHCEHPNIDFSEQTLGVALQNLAAGDELTCDYRQFTLGEVVHQPPRHRVHGNGSIVATQMGRV